MSSTETSIGAAEAVCDEVASLANSDSTETLAPRAQRDGDIITKSSTKLPPNKYGPWMPMDQECDLERESKLMETMESHVRNFGKSRPCLRFLNKLQHPFMLNRVSRVLGYGRRLPMVIYGIGSLEADESPRLQLSLALAMQRSIPWIGDIEVFDPVLSLTEFKVLRSLGCKVLMMNEQCRRKALVPTLFFMPHCDLDMYENLLETNWEAPLLSRCIIFGNSFRDYINQFIECRMLRATFDPSRMRIWNLACSRFIQEMKVTGFGGEFSGAFDYLSWHFFLEQPPMDAWVCCCGWCYNNFLRIPLVLCHGLSFYQSYPAAHYILWG